MSAVGDALGKQIGPLPAGAWVVVVVGGLAIGSYARRATTRSTPIDSGEVDTAFGTAPTAGNLGGGGGGSSNTGGLISGGKPTIDTNEKWRQVVITELLGRGYSPSIVNSAISKYFAGEPLTDQEAAAIDAAYLYVGPTPQIVPPALSLPPTTIQEPPPPNPGGTQANELAQVNSGNYSIVGQPGVSFNVVGSIGADGKYHGFNVSGGAPVYAYLNGQWVQNFPTEPGALPVGTQLAVPSTFEDYIVKSVFV